MKKIPAPLDQKNVTTDWIESIFDDWHLAYGIHRVVGFVAGCIVDAKWHENVLEGLVCRETGGDCASAFLILEERLKAMESEDQNVESVIEHEGEGRYCLIQSFFFRDEE
jgi:hypothetical protein